MFLAPSADWSTEKCRDSGAGFHGLGQTEGRGREQGKLFPFPAEAVRVPYLGSPTSQDRMDLGCQRACRIIFGSAPGPSGFGLPQSKRIKTGGQRGLV